MWETGLVSVIVPAYNAEKFIVETLRSVLAQTYLKWECIIVDDGSSDKTPEIVSEFCAKDIRFKFLQGKHGGVSRARNLGIDNSQGEYIALLDHDDIWQNDKLEKQIKLFLLNPDVGFVFSEASNYTIGQSKTRCPSPMKNSVGWAFEDLLKENFITCASAVIRRNLIDQRGYGFNPDFEMVEEYDLFLWLSLRCKFGCIFEPLVTYVIHGNNDSLKRSEISIREMEVIRNWLIKDPVLISKGLLDHVKVFDRIIARRASRFEWQRNDRAGVIRLLPRAFGPWYFLTVFMVYLLFPYDLWLRLGNLRNKIMRLIHR